MLMTTTGRAGARLHVIAPAPECCSLWLESRRGHFKNYRMNPEKKVTDFWPRFLFRANRTVSKIGPKNGPPFRTVAHPRCCKIAINIHQMQPSRRETLRCIRSTGKRSWAGNLRNCNPRRARHRCIHRLSPLRVGAELTPYEASTCWHVAEANLGKG